MENGNSNGADTENFFFSFKLWSITSRLADQSVAFPPYVGEGSIKPTINLTGKIWEAHFQICGEKYDTLSIRAVIHLDVPYSPEAYLQETGRAGNIRVLKRGFWKNRITSPPALTVGTI